MGPIWMLALIVVAWAVFLRTASRRFRLMMAGRKEGRFDHLVERAKIAWRYAFVQEKMDYYQPSGIAHKLVFTGFIVLTLRTLVLWGRGFDPSFTLFGLLSPTSVTGQIYEFAKDTVAMLVVTGVAIFFYYRVIRPLKRITTHWEGTLILGIIGTMMLADMMYDGAGLALAARRGLEFCTPGDSPEPLCQRVATIVAPFPRGSHGSDLDWSIYQPAGSLFGKWFRHTSPSTLVVLAHVGYWVHSTLVLVFLNLLPLSKHFHVITAIFNVFLKDVTPPGRLRPMAENGEKLMELVGTAAEAPDPAAIAVGVARIEHFSWKAILDFYTCTECGRCSDNCPAHKTGKLLSPKQFTLDLRNHLYSREDEILALGKTAAAKPAGATAEGADAAQASAEAKAAEVGTATEAGPINVAALKAIDLVSNVIHPDVLWACTTCRACEEQCPVMISYVDKIIDMRRNLVLVKGEFPSELQTPFQAMETNGNPWNLSRSDRAAWSDGLNIPKMSEKPNAEVLYWVGCAASYDDRAKKIARATAKLLQAAGVDFAILAEEESCTGDPARRAGNEFLFTMLAEQNAATLNGYKEQGGVRRVITACPHCFNTLKNEYPDLGAKLEVVHHTDFLLELLLEKKLEPKHAVKARVTYHDSCYLGRYNGVYESPREILRRIGAEVVEPEYWAKQRGLCCGAGGAQMWMEEQNHNRVNVKRTLQLIDTGAKTIASACPFCMTMLSDGLKNQNLETEIRQLDIAELLAEACFEGPKVAPAPIPELPKSEEAVALSAE